MRATLVCLIGFSICLFRALVLGWIIEGVGGMSRVEDDLLGVGSGDEIESVMEVSGEEDVVGNVV